MKIFICLQCGKEFKAKYRSNRIRKYCSLQCSRKSLIGKKKAPYQHHLQTEATRKKISEAQKGEKGNSWKKDRSLLSKRHNISWVDLERWGKAIKNRDNRTCILCHRRGEKLNAHHIDRVIDNPSLALDLSNGTTLCVSCHYLVHYINWAIA